MKIRLSQLLVHASLLASIGLFAGNGHGAVVGPKGFTVGGRAGGLVGTVVLQNNGGNDLKVGASGVFTFSQLIASGGAYNVTVKTQPAKQTCVVTQGAGTIAGANVTNVAVSCGSSTPTFTVGGTVGGLNGTAVLQNNGGNDLTVSASGTFKFTTALESGAAYNVSVKTQPQSQSCTVTHGSGTIANANVTNVAVACSNLPAAVLQADPGVRSATLSWQPPGGATSFNVYMSSARNCDVRNYTSCPDGALLINVTSPLATPNLRNGQAYFFKVESVFANGGRSLSNEAGARPNVIAFDGHANVITPSADGSVYLGGAFSLAGITTGSAVPLNAQTGRLASPDFPIVVGSVAATAPDGAGGWYIGGTFTQVGGVPRSNLAHILANGTVDPSFDPGADAFVSAIAVSANAVYVGGGFTVVGGVARTRLVAFSKGGALLPWNPGANGTVNTLAISGSTIYAGGSFSAVNGVFRNHLAAIDANGTLLPWSPGTGPSSVFALAVSGNTIYVGGNFDHIGATPRNFLAAFSSDGTLLPWNPQPNGFVQTLGVAANTVYAGGSFDFVGTTQRRKVAAIKADTGELLPWNPSPNGSVQTLLVSGSTVYIGGIFSDVGGTPRSRAAAIDVSGALLPWDPRASGVVSALAVAGNTVYAGGSFTATDAVARSHLAALDANGALLPWNPALDPNAFVNALLISGSTVYVGGSFTTIGGSGHPYLAAVGTNGVVVESFNPAAGSTLNNVLSLAASGNMLYVGGFFTEHLATYFKVDAPGNAGQRVAWNPGINGVVSALAMEGVSLYVGGSYTSINGISRQHLALLNTALDPLRPVLLAWEVRANDAVNRLVPGSGQVYAAGFFTALDNGSTGSQPRNHFGTMTGGAGIPSWPAQPDLFVQSMATSADAVYVAGNFTSIGGIARKGLAAISMNGVLDGNFHPEVTGPSASTSAIAVANGKIYVGGEFTSIGGKPRGCFATLNPDGTVID